MARASVEPKSVRENAGYNALVKSLARIDVCSHSRDVAMNDAAALVGAYRLVTAMQGGRDVTALCDPAVVYRMEGTRLLVQSREGGVIGECRLPSAEGANCIDMTYLWKGTEFVTRGIYRCEGDDLIVCFGGSQRPDSFDGTVADGRIVYTYRRIAAAPPASESDNGGRNASTQPG